jgi:hypothetical protein
MLNKKKYYSWTDNPGKLFVFCLFRRLFSQQRVVKNGKFEGQTREIIIFCVPEHIARHRKKSQIQCPVLRIFSFQTTGDY